MKTEDRIKLIRQLEGLLAKMQAKGWAVTRLRYGENYGEGGFYATIQIVHEEQSAHTGII